MLNVNTFFPPKFAFAGSDSDRICNHEQIDCAKRIWNTLQQKDSVNYKSCECLPDCNYINYDYHSFKDTFKVENQTKDEYEASMTFYFADFDYSAHKRSESFGTVQLASNIGGILELFMGVSVLSIVETIYFFTLRFFNDLWHKPEGV